VGAGPFRVALVGAGTIAATHLTAIDLVDDVELVAVVDANREAAEKLAVGRDVAVFTDHLQLVDQVGFDAAIICTPPATHADIAEHLLHHGHHILCEKPLTVGLNAACALVDRAHRSERLLMMASKFRYVADVARARKMIANGAIGAPVMFENAFTARLSMVGRWHADPGVSGGGVIIDNGTHSVDVTRYLFGPIVDLLAVEGVRLQGLQVEDTATLTVRCATGVTGNIDLSWTVDKRLDHFARVHGSDGTLELGWRKAVRRDADGAVAEEFGQGYDKLDCFRAQLVDFVGAARGEREPLLGDDDALASVAAIDAAYRSLAATRWERVQAPWGA
jgi:predicted dehydrogenase